MKALPSRPVIRLRVIIIAVGVLIVSLVSVGAYVWFSEHPIHIYPSYDPSHPTAAQQNAIEDAREWRENRILGCLTVVTPAVHPETGARYTFSDSCMAPGWVSEN